MQKTSIFSPKGKSSRGDYAKVVIPAVFVNMFLNIASRTTYEQVVAISISVLSLGIVFLIVFATIRRLRDIGRTPWMSVLLIVPVVGLMLIVYLLFAQSKTEDS